MAPVLWLGFVDSVEARGVARRDVTAAMMSVALLLKLQVSDGGLQPIDPTLLQIVCPEPEGGDDLHSEVMGACVSFRQEMQESEIIDGLLAAALFCRLVVEAQTKPQRSAINRHREDILRRIVASLPGMFAALVQAKPGTLH